MEKTWQSILWLILLVGISLLIFPVYLSAHGPKAPLHQSYQMGDLNLESGETIKDFSISYVTHGKLNENKSNAVLMVTAIGGNHHRIDFLIGPGKALDPSKYFIVCTDAIGNGLTTSPSNSTAQPRMQFPRFSIRDMVLSEYRLLTEHLGISHVITVIGPSMGGMQSMQWGVSYPDFMDSLVPMVPLAKSPAWTAAILETMRKAIMLDPEWNNGNYTQIPENGMRLFWDILIGISARNPEVYRYQFTEGLEVLPWLKTWEDKLVKVLDPNDWIYQSWAYQEHDIGQTPGMDGDLIKALRSIKAKTLILTGQYDLLNPEWESREAARYMPNARCVTINPFTVAGHLSASGANPVDVEFLNREIGEFLDTINR